MKIEASKENKREFLKMLAWIQLCGDVGHTCQWFRVGVDGDGTGRLRFTFDDTEDLEIFNDVKKELMRDYNKGKGDLKQISFE